MSSLVVDSSGLWLIPEFWPRTNSMAWGITSNSFMASWPAPLGMQCSGTPRASTARSQRFCHSGALGAADARMVDANGNERAFQVHATDDPREVSGAKFAIVLVKSWQTARVARQLKESLALDGHALTLQNGLGNLETLALDLGMGRVSMGVTTTGATLVGPGLVRAGGEGVISIERNQALGPLETALRSSNFNLQIVADAQSLIWGKLVINAAINPRSH